MRSVEAGGGSEIKPLNESRREARLYYGFGVLPAKAIKVCPDCKTVCRASESFCTSCGAKLPEKNLYDKSVEGAEKCPGCGAILVGSESFCPICGIELRTEDPQSYDTIKEEE